MQSLPQRLLFGEEEGEELDLLRRRQPVPLADRGRGVPLAVPLHPLVPGEQ